MTNKTSNRNKGDEVDYLCSSLFPDKDYITRSIVDGNVGYEEPTTVQTVQTIEDGEIKKVKLTVDVQLRTLKLELKLELKQKLKLKISLKLKLCLILNLKLKLKPKLTFKLHQKLKLKISLKLKLSRSPYETSPLKSRKIKCIKKRNNVPTVENTKIFNQFRDRLKTDNGWNEKKPLISSGNVTSAPLIEDFIVLLRLNFCFE
ncbi:unnamed protein product [Nesidiocoris tenuis]|uniref:Uncharacterized protein n=1 Tax=Nesidiocoris tenuis TaxID=355587 RepID=A0A6H5GSA6_9HEMI|nr:unnamed protein product [Nesidiocoris tenuis]